MSPSAAITQLVPGVYVHDSPFFQSKRTLIVDGSGSTLVDTPVAFADTRMLLALAEAESRPVRRIILTHSHFDHSAGCQLLPAAERIAQRGAGEWMLSPHATSLLTRRPTEHPDLAQLCVTLPTMELEGAASVRLQQRTLRLLPTPGHSPDSMSLLLEPDGILFTGDGFVTCFPPIIQDGDSAQAVATHKRILALDFAYVVPGHGPVLPATEARRHCRTSLRYLQQIRRALARLDPETPLEVVLTSVQDLCSLFPFPEDMTRHWHEHAVAKVWEERRQNSR